MRNSSADLEFLNYFFSFLFLPLSLSLSLALSLGNADHNAGDFPLPFFPSSRKIRSVIPPSLPSRERQFRPVIAVAVIRRESLVRYRRLLA